MQLFLVHIELPFPKRNEYICPHDDLNNNIYSNLFQKLKTIQMSIKRRMYKQIVHRILLCNKKENLPIYLIYWYKILKDIMKSKRNWTKNTINHVIKLTWNSTRGKTNLCWKASKVVSWKDQRWRSRGSWGRF